MLRKHHHAPAPPAKPPAAGKELIIAQLSKMENASTDLLKQVEELKTRA